MRGSPWSASAARHVLAILVLSGAGFAQESGDSRHGGAIARQICSPCHAIERGEATSPMADAPSFDSIAATPGMTPLALTVVLRGSHQSMPSLVLPPDEHNDVIAYILGLKAGP